MIDYNNIIKRGGEVVNETIMVPRKLVEEAKKRGIDVEEIVIRALAEALELDPGELAWVRLELAEKMLGEAKDYLAKGDAVQASEKLYKAVEECIKLLAQLYRLPEYEKAVREGRWWTQLLGKAARRLSKRFSEPRLTDAWARAYDIHIWGFHEAKYGVEDIREDLQYAKWLVEYVKKLLAEAKASQEA